MGLIINILGPHGVGKTTLQNYIRNNSLGVVAEGFILPIKGVNLSDQEEYLKYEEGYLAYINEQNKAIKKALMNGYVIRSVEEVEYFLRTYNPSIEDEKIRKIIENDSNISCDLIVYLDSKKATLDERIAGDTVRDQIETTDWYNNDFDRYDFYWKKFERTNVIDTTNLSVSEVFDEITKLISNFNKHR